MSISNIRYYLRYTTQSGQVTQQAQPLDSGATYAMTLQDYKRLKELTGKLVFSNEPSKNIYDYDKIKAAEQYDASQQITLFVQRFDGSAWLPLATAYFSVFDCEINDDLCRATVSVDIDDSYRCIKEDEKTEYNVLSEVGKAPSYIIVNPVNLEFFTCKRNYTLRNQCSVFNTPFIQTNIQNQQIDALTADELFYDTTPLSGYNNMSNSPNLGGILPYGFDTHPYYNLNEVFATGEFYTPNFPYYANFQNLAAIIGIYRIFRNKFTKIRPANTIYDFEFFEYEVETTWCIETVITLDDPITGQSTTPSGGGWIPLLQTTYVGLPAVIFGRVPFYNASTLTYSTEVYGCYDFTLELINPYTQDPALRQYIHRGRTLNDTIQMFLNKSGCGLTFKSDFFQSSINPVTGENNAFYILNQCTDIKAPTSVEPAIYMFMSFDKLLSNLREIFDVRWHIDGADFIIEHISYYENGYTYQTSQIPVTDVRFRIGKQTGKNEIVFTNNYVYDVANIYKAEKWNNLQYLDIDFAPLQIDYNLTIIKDNKINERNIDFILDVAGVISTPSNFSNDAVVMVAYRIEVINPQYGTLWPVVVNEPGYRTGTDVTNGWLCLSNLFNRFWRHNRVKLTGTLGNNTEQFFSETKKIIQNIELQDCGCNFVDDMQLIRTNLGVGEIIAAENNLATGVSRITLKI